MKKRFKIPILFFVSLFFIVGIIYLLLTQTTLLQSQINYWVSFYLSKNYPLKIKIGKINGSIFNELILHDVHLLYDTPENKYTILKTSRIDLRYNPFDFLKGKIVFNYAELDSPQIKILKKNEKYLLPSSKKKKRITLAPKKPLDLRLDTLLINDGTFTLLENSHPVQIKDINLLTSLKNLDDKKEIKVIFCNFEYADKDLKVKKIGGNIEVKKDTIFLSDLALNTEFSKIKTYGTISNFKNPEINLDIKAHPFNFDELTKLINSTLSGEFEIEGKIEGNLKSFKGYAKFSGDLFKRAFENVDLKYSYKNKVLYFSQIRGRVFRSYLSGSGNIDFGKKPVTYKLQAQAKNLNLPNIVSTSLDTDFSGKVSLEGQGFSEKDFLLSMQVDLDQGKLEKYSFDQAEGGFFLDLSSIHFLPDFKLKYKNTEALCEGDLDYQGKLNINAQVFFADLSEFEGKTPIKKIRGGGKAKLQIDGRIKELKIKAELTSDSLWVYEFFSPDFSGYIYLENLPAQKKGKLSFQSLSGSIWGIDYDSTELKLKIEDDLIKIDTLWIKSDNANINLCGIFDNSISPSQLIIEGLKGNFKDNFFEITSNVKISIDKNFLDLKNLELKSNRGSFKFIAKLDYPDKIDFKTSFSEIDLSFLTNTFLSQKNIFGILKGDLSIRKTLPNPVIRLKTEVVDLKYKQVDLGELETEVFYKDKKINFEKFELSYPGGKYALKGYLPFLFSFAPLKKEFLDSAQSLQIKGEGEELKIFYPFLSFIEYIKGPFEAKIDVLGTPLNRKIDGELKLSKGTMKLMSIRDPIVNLDSELKLKDNILMVEKFEGEVKHKSFDSESLFKKIWRFFFPKRMKKGEVGGFGTIEFKSLKNIHFDLNIAGMDLPLNYEYLDLSAISDLNLEITGPNPPTISGELFFHQLHFREPFSALNNTSPQKKKNGKPVDLNFSLQAFNNCWIINEDMNLEFKGDLLVKKERGDLKLLGELETIRGKYFLFGTSFKIKKGKFIFDNLEKIDPKLDFLVSADVLNPVSVTPVETPITSSGEKIELSILGTLSAPEVNPASGSPYSREEMIELLTFGQRLSALDTLGTKSLFEERVIKSLSVGYGGRILENLAIKTLGVETFEIRPAWTGKFSLGETEITLGKYISEKIYLKYTRTLSQSTGDETGVEYRLSRHLFFEGYKDKKGKFHLGLNLNWEY